MKMTISKSCYRILILIKIDIYIQLPPAIALFPGMLWALSFELANLVHKSNSFFFTSQFTIALQTKYTIFIIDTTICILLLKKVT